jgi:hypothetical protein
MPTRYFDRRGRIRAGLAAIPALNRPFDLNIEGK